MKTNNMIPTAEEFIKSTELVVKFDNTQSCILEEELPRLFIEFAKLHVEAALKEALESIPCLGSSSDIATYEEVEDAVLNAYPLTLIK
jgi:hypothetical protein